MKRAALIIGIILTVAVIVVFAVTILSPPLSKTKEQVGSETVIISNFTTLIEDFNDLPEIKDGFDLKERNAKGRILFLLRSDDPEIEKAFEIMQKYGRPSNFTSYDFPMYNTQLEVLFWLAEEREICDYDRIALAIALDYGTVLAISEEGVRKELKDYVVEMYDYYVETDALVPWDIRAYPLEADIALVWGANGINHPLFFERANQYPEETKYSKIGIPNYYDLNWIVAFRDEKMNEEDFDWLFVDVETLREIREFLMHDMFSEGKGLRVNGVSERVDSMLCGSLEYHTDKPSADVTYIEVEGRITPGCGLSNPDWQWKYFKEEGSIVGNCRDVTCMNIFFLKSLNIPAIGFKVRSGSSFGHQVVAFYDYEKEDLWRITSNQRRIIDLHVNDSKLQVGNYFPVVWSNWHEMIYPEYSYEELKTLEEGFAIRDIG